MTLKVIDGIMGIKESEWKLPTVDHRFLESKGEVMSMWGIRGLSDQKYEIIIPDMWKGEERQDGYQRRDIEKGRKD